MRIQTKVFFLTLWSLSLILVYDNTIILKATRPDLLKNYTTSTLKSTRHVSLLNISSCNPERFSLVDYAYMSSNTTVLLESILYCYSQYHNRVVRGEIEPHFLVGKVSSGLNLGWGNRIEQLLGSFFVAVLSGRAFLVDWNDNDLPLSLFISTNYRINFDYLDVISKYKYVNSNEVIMKWDNLEIESFNSQNIPTKNIDISNKPIAVLEPNIFLFPFNNYYQGQFRHLIPKLLGEWKTSLMKYFFSVSNDIKILYDKFKGKYNYTQLIGVHLRTLKSFNPHVWGCIDYFKQKYPNATIFIATDNESIKYECKLKFSNCIFSDVPPAHMAGLSEISMQFQRNNLISMLNVVFEWWVLVNSDFLILTHKSSFGYTAADMFGCPRFIMGMETQCEFADQPFYLEKIYFPLLESYVNTGYMVYFPEQ